MIGEPKKTKQKRFSMVFLLGVVVIVILIVVNIIVWRNYSDKHAQADALNAKVELVEQQISQVEPAPSDLESKLNTAKNELAEALQVFPANIDKNDVVDFILTTAEECYVELVPLTAQGGGAVGAYYQVRYSGTVTGKLSQVSDFMTKLHNGKYATMVIIDCSVQRMSVPDVSVVVNDFDVTVRFNVTLYASSIEGK